MADNTLAMQVNANPIDLQKTIGTLSQLQLAQAHSGLYGLQAQQEARKLHGLEYLQTNPSDYQGAISRGLDPSVGSTLQIMGERQRQYGTNPQGLSTESASQLTTAGKNIAETGKIGVETDTQKMQNMGRIAQGYLADPTEESWRRSITDAKARGYVNNDMQAQQFLAVKDPKQRERIASSLIMGGVSPAEATAQHNVEPTQAVTSRMGTMNPPTPTNINPNPAVANGILDRPALPVAGVNKDQTRLPSTPVGTLPPQMTPGQVEEQKGVAEANTANYKESLKRYDSASKLMSRLDIMDHEIQNLGPGWMGTGADARGAMVKGLNSAIDAIPGGGGLKINPDKVASWESLNKETTRAGMELINSNFGGSREAASIVQMGRAAVTSSNNTYYGALTVASSIRAGAQREMDLHQYKEQLVSQGQSLVGAETQFNKIHPPREYADQAINGSAQTLARHVIGNMPARISSQIPEAAFNLVTQNPKVADQFDKKYGTDILKQMKQAGYK